MNELSAEGRVLGRDTTREELEAFLKKYGVTYLNWKKPWNKTLVDLLKELREGTSTIIIRNGRPVRITKGVTIDVCYPLSSQIMHVLEEQWQKVKKWKRQYERRREVFHTLKGKLKPDQSPIEAVRECIREKLRFKIDLELVPLISKESPFQATLRFLRKRNRKPALCGLIRICEYKWDDPDPEGFKGLPTQREHIVFVLVLAEKFRVLTGYRRTRNGQTTLHQWTPKKANSDSYLFQTVEK